MQTSLLDKEPMPLT